MVYRFSLKPRDNNGQTQSRLFMWRSLLSYIDFTVSTAMGCFIACFRGSRDSDRRLPPLSTANIHLFTSRSSSSETVPSRNHLSSLFLSEEREDSAHNLDKKKNASFESLQINKELAVEAKFLKACGTLAETPTEIRKASLKRSLPPLDKAAEPPDFHSWLPHTSITKFQLDKQTDKPSTSAKQIEEVEKVDIVSLEKTPSRLSFMSTAQSTGRISVDSNQIDKATLTSLATNIHCNNKSVHFECNDDSSGDLSVSRCSPRPTPLKISDEMQTPGTVFPGTLDKLANGNARIRSEFVFSTSNPVENTPQSQVRKEGGITSLHHPGKHNEELNTESESGLKETSTMKGMKLEASFSPWLKGQQSKDDPSLRSASKHPWFGATPGDRPIIGMVAAHWNENEVTHVPQKWWDGNGIPNSTNKYKEDQKVSWHATPFEERLEKALSEENSLITQKKDINGRPITFDECDDDTAVSKLQPTTQTKSVVSY